MTNAPSLEVFTTSAPFELNRENVEKGLLQYNYFPRSHDHKEEMPAFFNSEKFLPALAKKILAIDLSKDRAEKFLIHQFALTTLVSLASKAPEIFKSSKIEVKRSLIGFVFSNLEMKGGSLCYSLREPFCGFQSAVGYHEWLGC
jgi:hypothetical protein